MAKRLPIILWILALLAGGWLVYSKSLDDGRVAEIDPQLDGRAFGNINWKHLHNIPNFELTERSGEQFNSEKLAGRPYVVSFFFSTCPTICLDLNRQIARLADQFRNTDLTFLSITVDPKNDSPQVLRQYAEQFQADGKQWLFLTGKWYKIRELGEQRFNVLVDTQKLTADTSNIIF